MNKLILVKPLDLEENPAMIYLARLTARSGRYTQAQVVRFIADWLGGTVETINWGGIRYEHSALLVTKIAEMGYAPATRMKYHSALRGILEQAFLLGQMTADEYARAANLAKVRGERLPAGRFIEDEEIAKLFQAAYADRNPATAARDAAILAVMYLCGPRRSEVTAMTLDNYTEETGELRILGKGNKQRLSFLVGRGKEAMTNWLDLRGREPGALFLAIGKSGKVRPGNMTSQAVYNMIAKRISEAGLTDISPHDFRRTSISRQLDAGTDLTLAARMYGHANPQTTARYDRRPDDAMRVAAQKLDIPTRDYSEGSVAPIVS